MFRSGRRPTQDRRIRSRRLVLGLESLESRQLLDAKVTLANGVLTIDADNTNGNDVEAAGDPNHVFIGIENGTGAMGSLEFPTSEVRQIVYNGDTSAGSFEDFAPIPAVIHGHGAGDNFSINIVTQVLITEDSSSARFSSSPFIPVTVQVTDPDPVVRLASTEIHSATRNYQLFGVKNVQLQLAQPALASNLRQVDLSDYDGAVAIDASAVTGRLALNPGRGNLTVTGNRGPTVVEFNNTSSLSFANNTFDYNGGSVSINHVTSVTALGGSGPVAVDLAGFTGASVIDVGRSTAAAVIRGGSGGNTIIDDSGPATVLPSANPNGDNVEGIGLQYLSFATGAETSAERTAPGGSLVVFLEPDGKTLEVIGPTGLGFGLVGNWSVSDGGNGARTFQATGSVTLVSSGVDLTFSGGGLVQATTSNPFLDFGTLTSGSLSGLSLNTSLASDPFHGLESTFGFHADATTATWNIGLPQNLPGSNLPLSAAVPYLLANVVPGSGTTAHVSLAGSVASTTAGQSLQIAIDPSDPSIMAQSGNFEVGASLQGEIPFVAQSALAGNPALFGNLLSTATILGIGSLPISLQGATILALDAQHTSHLSGVTPGLVTRLLSDQVPLSQALPGGLADVALGTNGTIDVGYAPTELATGATPIDLTIEMTPAQLASGALVGGSFTFASTGATIKPGFASGKATPLSALGPDLSELSGFVSSATPHDQISATLTLPAPTSLEVPAGLATQFLDTGINLSGNSVSMPIFGAIPLTGSIDGSGNLVLNGQVATTMAYDTQASSAVIQNVGSGVRAPTVTLTGNFSLLAQASKLTNPTNETITFNTPTFIIPSYKLGSISNTQSDALRIQGSIAVSQALLGGDLFTVSGTASGTRTISRSILGPQLELVSLFVHLAGNQLKIEDSLGVVSGQPSFDHRFVFDLATPAFPQAKLTALTANG